jgi:uncharacterized protein YegL
MLKQKFIRGQCKDEHGAYFVIFVMLLAMLVGAVGLAADMTRAFRVTRVMQRAVDLGALAGIAIRAEYGPGVTGTAPGGASYGDIYKQTACRTVEANALISGLDIEATFSTGEETPKFYDKCLQATKVEAGGGQVPPSVQVDFSGNNTLPFAVGFAASSKLLGDFDFPGLTVSVGGKAQLNRAAVTLVLDYSGSMNCPNTDGACDCVTNGGCGTSNLKIDILRSAAKEFTNRFTNSWDRVALIPFNGRGVVAWPLTKDLNKDEINKRLVNYKAGGGTNISHALYLANEEFENPNFKTFQQTTGRFERSVVLFTDGAPTSAVVKPELVRDTTNNSAATTQEGFITSQLNLIAQSTKSDNTVSYKYSAPGPLVRLSSLKCAKYSEDPPCNKNLNPPTTESTGGKIPFGYKNQLPPGISFTVSPPYPADKAGFVADPHFPENQAIMPLCSTTRGTSRIPASINDPNFGAMARELWQNNWTQLAPGQTAWFCLLDKPANTITAGATAAQPYAKFNALESMGRAGLVIPGSGAVGFIRHSVYTALKPNHRANLGTLARDPINPDTLASPVIARHFEELYFNAALAEADAITSKDIGIYTIGLGRPAERFTTSTGAANTALQYGADAGYFAGEAPNGSSEALPTLNPGHPDKSPYQLPERIGDRDFGLRYDYFLARLSNDRMAGDYAAGESQCLRKKGCQFDWNFNAGASVATGNGAYERRFNGMIGTWDTVWGDEKNNMYKRGWYQPATSNDSLNELFARIARRILLRGIS